MSRCRELEISSSEPVHARRWAYSRETFTTRSEPINHGRLEPWTRLLVPKAVQVGVSSIFLVRKWSPGPRQGLIEPRIAAAPINQASSFDSARSSTQPNLEVLAITFDERVPLRRWLIRFARGNPLPSLVTSISARACRIQRNRYRNSLNTMGEGSVALISLI